MFLRVALFMIACQQYTFRADEKIYFIDNSTFHVKPEEKNVHVLQRLVWFANGKNEWEYMYPEFTEKNYVNPSPKPTANIIFHHEL